MPFRRRSSCSICAARAVAALDEPDSAEPAGCAQPYRTRGADRRRRHRGGCRAARAGYRIFGSKPGAYGAGLQALIDEKGWSDGSDLARAYLAWGGYAYGSGDAGAAEGHMFEKRLAQVDAVLHNQDNREHDLLDSDDYYQFEGGLAATVQHLTGRKAVVWHNDHSRPETPKIRSLDEEIARVVRARVVNPKWIAGRDAPWLQGRASRWRRPWIICSPSRRRRIASPIIISTRCSRPICWTTRCGISSPRTIRHALEGDRRPPAGGAGAGICGSRATIRGASTPVSLGQKEKPHERCGRNRRRQSPRQREIRPPPGSPPQDDGGKDPGRRAWSSSIPARAKANRPRPSGW